MYSSAWADNTEETYRVKTLLNGQSPPVGKGVLMMTDQLLQRRETTTTRHDTALDRWWPNKRHPEYRQEVMAVAKELEDIFAQAEIAEWSGLERSRTLRWLADAYADLAVDDTVSSGEDLAWLSRAASTYAQAEPLFQREESPRDSAVLNFNYANTLRRFDIENTSLLESSQRRYQMALEYFSRHEPGQAARVQQALDSVNVLLQLAPISQAFQETRQRIDRLDELVESRADSSQIRAEFMRVLENGGPPILLNQVIDLINDMPDSVRQQDKDGKLQGLVSHALMLSNDGASEAERDAEILIALRARLVREIDAKNVDIGRADVVRDAIGSVDKTLASGTDDIASIRARMLDTRAGAKALMPAMKDLSYGLPLPKPDTRAAQARELFWGTRHCVLQDLTLGGHGESERAVLYEFAKQLTELDKRLVKAAQNDALAMRIEAESIRPAITQVRKFAARRRAYLANPIWTNAPRNVDSNALFYSGDDTLQRPIRNWCAKREITFMEIPHGSGYANTRWEQITSANTVVVDMTPGVGHEQAACAYELGVAMTLGKSVLVAFRGKERLPFDIDLPAIRLEGGSNIDGLVAALDAAFYWVPAAGTDSSIVATIDEARRRFAENNSVEITQSLKDLDQLKYEDNPDAIEAGRILESLMSFAGPSAQALISPTWCGVYPEEGVRRMFHVMPFGPEWADATAEAAEQASTASGFTYIRGDRVADPQIIRSIWEELCRASHVLVDITGFNANVAFELGIAHSLGKQVFIVAQEEAIDDLFGMIEKNRVNVYGRASISDQLGAAITKWLA